MASCAVSDLPDGRRVIALAGRLDAASVPSIWDPVHRALDEAPARPVTVDAAEVESCDGAGIALLVDLASHARAAPVEVVRMRPDVDTLYRQFDLARLEHDLDPPPKPLGVALVYAIAHPASVRWRDVWRICERVGADALPIVALISFLLGLILAFQSAVPMKRFGAEIFVADLLGLSVLRELGPLMTAILLAGRSGAAFAAEIGTMTVNQEVDALTTMGLDPVRFLVT